MIKLDSYNKIDILYRNYVKQFSPAYIKGSSIYVGKSLKDCININKNIAIQNLIKTYKKNFIDLYMNSNKIHDELIAENICIICLEPLNESIMDVCHKCNVQCHIQCLYDWYKKQDAEICPICLETEEYYLNILENGSNKNNDTDNSDVNDNLNSDVNDNANSNIINYINEIRSYTFSRNNAIAENTIREENNIIARNNMISRNNINNVHRIDRDFVIYDNNEPLRFCFWILCFSFCIFIFILSIV